METVNDEEFVPYPKRPELFVVNRKGQVMNLQSKTLMLPWKNEEDNDRLWVNLRITEPGRVTDIEVAVWRMIKDAFGEDYVG